MPTAPMENEHFLRTETQGVFVVVWKRPPTSRTLAEALEPPIRRFKSSPNASQAFIIVSLAGEPISHEANREAAFLAKTYAKQFKALAVIEPAGKRRGVANRVALRMILATAGVFGFGPTVGFFHEPHDGADWVANKLAGLKAPVDANALRSALDELIARASPLGEGQRPLRPGQPESRHTA